MATTTKAVTLSIQKEPGYKDLKNCAQTCVDRNNNNGDLEGHLDCGDIRILDSCFCAADTRPKATTFLSSCIITKCKHDQAELTSALKLYDGYCDFKPLTTSKKSSTTTTKSTSSRKTSSTATPAASSSLPSSSAISSETSSTLESSSSLPTLTPTPTPTPEGAATPGSATAMGPGTIAGIAIGGIAAVFLAMSVLMWYCRRGQKDEPHDPYFGRVQKEDPFEPGRGVGAASGVPAASPYRDHSGFSSPAVHQPGGYRDADAAYVAGGAAAAGVAGGGMYYNSVKGRSAGSSFVSSVSERRGEPESYDLSAMSPARPVDFTSTTPMMAAMTPPPPVTPVSAASSGGFPMSPGGVRRKPVPVEIGSSTTFRAELDAGNDGVGGYRGEKG
ncbi:hypothetical protein QBC34DRAFT_490044 [Podospora aff. communis PSN243]|uniref:Extracellular membrane protein CFEM domain-containing protein n=1 Tax=Podospora aff. communis PSN243 TaxID=3040156 RepID=A0AAV9H1L2_9PEZI|nr:hypothetical protein QBC34DRAFT_490044 [Podospora aff. communis PSN243]